MKRIFLWIGFVILLANCGNKNGNSSINQKNQKKNVSDSVGNPFVDKSIQIVVIEFDVNAHAMKFWSENKMEKLINQRINARTLSILPNLKYTVLNSKLRIELQNSISNHSYSSNNQIQMSYADMVWVGHDCAFAPHHGLMLLDKYGKLKGARILCFWCAKEREYGTINGVSLSLKDFYQFFQFNGFDSHLADPDAMHSFATKEEIKCGRLRKYPTEKLECDSDASNLF